MRLYRIAYVAASQAHSLVRELAAAPELGERIALDETTVVVVREIVSHGDEGSIAADIVAEMIDTTLERAVPGATGSASRSSR